MADTVAVISIIASSTVALGSLGVQVWQARTTRNTERQDWLRDRRAEAYLSMLPLFVKPPEALETNEFPQLWARLQAFGTPEVKELFSQWSAVVSEANTLPEGSPHEQWEALRARSESIARAIEQTVSAEMHAGG